MTQFKDLDEFLDPTLKLTIRGKVYSVDSPDAEIGLWCQRLFATGVKAEQGDEVSAESIARLDFSDEEEKGIYGRVLGPTMDEMLADGIPWEYLRIAGMTALIWTAGDEAAAAKYWMSGGRSPKANRAQRRATAKSGPRASTGTKSPRKAPAKKASAGRSS